MDVAAVPVVLHYHGGGTESVLAAAELVTGSDSVTIVRSSGDPTTVALADLKAIFFLRTRPLSDGEPCAQGKLLAVEFRDGEVIRGFSEEYTPDRNGFFLYPLDRSKNHRIFVVNAAIVSIDVETF